MSGGQEETIVVWQVAWKASMKTAEVKQDGDGAASIEAMIARFHEVWRPTCLPCALSFPPSLEAYYERETKSVRIREIRLVLALALVFYWLMILTDSVLFPDMGQFAILFRVAASPLVLFTIVYAPRVSALWRERLTLASAVFAVVTLTALVAISKAPFSPFGFAYLGLFIFYANTTLSLRFVHATLSTAICCTGILIAAKVNSVIDPRLVGVIILQAYLSTIFSLITAYRIEKSVKLGFLLGARDALHVAAIDADREKLAILSDTDALTGVANRGHFDRVAATLFASANIGRSIALVMVDVDYFKRYNDHYGHAMGDACLRLIAGALCSQVRGGDDLVARYGGEEFAILLLDVDERQADESAERIRAAIAALKRPHVDRGDGGAIVTISGGLACQIINEHHTIEMLLERADGALYAAKRGGRNRVVSGSLVRAAA